MTKYAADISSLVEEFQQRFRDFAAIEKEITLFSSPFSVDPDDAPDHLQLELIELQCDAEHRSRHQQLPLVNFYRQLDEGRFQAIRTFAKKMLSLFGSTYMCEKTFSVMNINKSRMRTRLSDSHLRDVLRIKTTALEPDMDYIYCSQDPSITLHISAGQRQPGNLRNPLWPHMMILQRNEHLEYETVKC
ncbi:general transcription factor II-I repeat domain-containing protein 2B-like [Syngnathoides biaculeatus]|uniref:general transcription factor II-I repeat domain-containing protein 2B-like n=1 Tax=Syngnathoides biaculeatus TaxID=300417 RepID=UPI002ADE5D00|nr:general transcription factor II-I repeat domain-containing protein 2B-like [Syngnathoides biaculeatus]XP_061668282.1 general transcription factor II-I repeat domain-containing protein 2B-like [Syngnathoides biaculeatus]XP_061668283.1 general transcription factor II-I repeat domain-containing protein 2B-like [Syngnathoides biaculeatus]XP_061668284.1 general transcription factor II-I repeat domain-containing protein 2B-like [Syngnathoides biaculeatus]XP_061668285.1 general transcription factor